MDVGCGVGLTAITSATLGAKQTIAVDISPLTLKVGTTLHLVILL